MKFLEEKFIPVAAALGEQRHLVAIRDGFVVTMPITIAGALAVLLLNFGGIFAKTGLNMPSVQEAYVNFLKTTGLTNILSTINRSTLSMLAVLSVTSIAYHLAKRYDGDGMAAGAIAMGCYLGLTPAGETGAVESGFLGSTGVFVAMIVAIISTEIFVRLSRNKKLKITMPDGVPPAVAKSFLSLLPGLISIALVSAMGTIIAQVTGLNVWELITKFVSAPLTNIADSAGTAFFETTLMNLLWIFGLHGTNIVGSITGTILGPLNLENMDLYAAGKEPIHTYTGASHSVFAMMGGSGCTLGALIAIFLFSKSKANRTVAQIAIAPGLFNINEPVTFGLPIVMNPVYAIPFVVGPTVLAVTTYFLMQLGIVGRICISAPWVTPPILLQFLATGGNIPAAIWGAVEIVLLTILWTPFVMMSYKMEQKNTAED